jgi:hypothetical protein
MGTIRAQEILVNSKFKVFCRFAKRHPAPTNAIENIPKEAEKGPELIKIAWFSTLFVRL